jgi:hypothetical protein
MRRSGVRSSSSPPTFLQAVDSQRLFSLRREKCGSGPSKWSKFSTMPVSDCSPDPVQTDTRPHARPHALARHLYQSRHGIWYFRWVVPRDLRARYPQLPTEVRRSTKTSQIRLARPIALDYLGKLLSAFSLGSSAMFDFADDRLNGIFARTLSVGASAARPSRGRHEVAPMVIERDPATQRITRIETQPRDTPEVLALIERLLHRDTTAERSRPARDERQVPIGPGAAADPEPGCDAAASPPRPQARPAAEQDQPVASPWLGDAIK